MDAPSARRDELRCQIANPAPVRPLPAPSRRTRLLMPLALLVIVAAPLLYGRRKDLTTYAPLATWGLSALQSCVGLWLLAMALREAVPGENVSTRALTLAASLALGLVVAVTLLTYALSPTPVPPGYAWAFWKECFIIPTLVASPLLLVATLMVARAFPTRPAVAGALCGLSAGILSDAGWRVSCNVSSPAHVFGAHGLAVLAMAGVGSLVAVLADSARWTRLRAARPPHTATGDKRT